MFILVSINKHSHVINNLSSSADFNYIKSRFKMMNKYKKYLKHCPRTYLERMNVKNIERKILKELHKKDCKDNFIFEKMYNHHIAILDTSTNKIFSNVRFLVITSAIVPFVEDDEYLKEKIYVKNETTNEWQNLKPSLKLKYHNLF